MDGTLGQVKSGQELGFKSGAKRIWHACIDCGKERYVPLERGTPRNLRCKSCSQKGAKNSNFKKGYKMSGKGYIQIKLQPDDFYFPMAKKDYYVLEHRLVVAKHLGRCLHNWEIVHHRGTKYPQGSKENRADNRIENLQLVSELGNKQLSFLENRIINLEKEVKLLRWQIKELNKTEVKI